MIYNLGIVLSINTNQSLCFHHESLRVENIMYCSEQDLEEQDGVASGMNRLCMKGKMRKNCWHGKEDFSN